MSQKRIRIESQPQAKGGSLINVTDADTGTQLKDLSRIVINLAVDDVVVADVSYSDGATQQRYVESIDVTISGEEVDKQ